MPILIRSETSSDAEGITHLIKSAFAKVEFSNQTEHFIVNALRDAGDLTYSFVAVDGERLIGHVAVSPIAASQPVKSWFGLGPISVTPEYQRQGIGSQLVLYALEVLRRSGASGCVVLGDPAYYGRFGFKAYPTFVFPGIPSKYFQALKFKGELPHGEVAYASAFNAAS